MIDTYRVIKNQMGLTYTYTPLVKLQKKVNYTFCAKIFETCKIMSLWITTRSRPYLEVHDKCISWTRFTNTNLRDFETLRDVGSLAREADNIPRLRRSANSLPVRDEEAEGV